MAATDAFMAELAPYRQAEGFVLGMNGNHLAKYELEILWNNIVKQIPLLAEKGITPHYFRHTYATHMYHETNDIPGAAKQCGHVNGQTTGHVYIHDDLEHKRNTVAQMEASLNENVRDFVQNSIAV